MLRFVLVAAAAGLVTLPSVAAAKAEGAAARPNLNAKAEVPLLHGLPDFIDGVMAQQLASREVAGAIVSVVSKGKILFARGYGFADVDTRAPADPERSLFRVASVSKLFTWTALMQLVEQGRIDLEADVNRYLDFRIPETQSRPILVKHLLDHRPGFEDRSGITVENVSEFEPLRDWLPKNIPTRVREPGIETSYSNYGTALAGYIVERVSGEPFAEYVERHIFKPLGMSRTTFREPLPGELAASAARGYRLIDGQFVAKPFEFYHNIMPAGAASSTAHDMARFMIAHLQDGQLGSARILKPETARKMRSDLSGNASALPGSAHGFFVLRQQKPRLIGHGGNTIDFHSMLLLAPEAGFGIFVVHTGSGESHHARTELVNAVIDRLFPMAAAPRWNGSVSVPPLGSYRANRRTYSVPADPKNDINISAQGARGLVLESAGQKTRWVQIGPGLYEQVTGPPLGMPGVGRDRIQFYGEPSDPRMSLASMPMVLYRLVKD